MQPISERHDTRAGTHPIPQRHVTLEGTHYGSMANFKGRAVEGVRARLCPPSNQYVHAFDTLYFPLSYYISVYMR